MGRWRVRLTRGGLCRAQSAAGCCGRVAQGPEGRLQRARYTCVQRIISLKALIKILKRNTFKRDKQECFTLAPHSHLGKVYTNVVVVKTTTTQHLIAPRLKKVGAHLHWSTNVRNMLWAVPVDLSFNVKLRIKANNGYTRMSCVHPVPAQPTPFPSP